MKIKKENKTIVTSFYFILFLFAQVVHAQIVYQVWGDEFDGSTIDNSIWSFDFGPANDNVHYFTDRSENAKIVDGKLQVIALEESYQGFNYTSALLNTQHAISWKYGRIEARIKLPGSNGFVPAFWMLPEDQSYGYWPLSGEIDILEHPTNEIDKIYGTVHTGAYNSFTGSGPRGSTITISDAETEFHVYAIEWSEEKIDFFVDDQKYFTFNNEQGGFDAWPFDQSFYIILSMGVGGSWVGNPDASSIFPAIMEVDYVRVYQELDDVQISGEDYLPRYTKSSLYTLPNLEGASYKWKVSGDAEIVSGQNTNNILINWNTLSGDVEAEINSNNTTYNYTYPVNVSNNYLKNYGFEKGVGHWFNTRPYPGDIDFVLDSTDPHTGVNCLYVDVKTTSTNAWDVQLSQRNLLLEVGNNIAQVFGQNQKFQEQKFQLQLSIPLLLHLLILNNVL
jgi:beta-glucanase (GH16 family)